MFWASLDDAARRALENEMQPGKYEYKSDFARRYFGEGREQGRQEGREEGRLEAARSLLLGLAERRLGVVDDAVRAWVAACADHARLAALVVEIGAAPDRVTVEQVLLRMSAAG